jgi:3-hydroxybutyryl-CoA dehydrogenase
MKQVRTITVLGAGTMGHGIAHAAASSGFETRMYDVSDAAVSKGRAQIESVFKKSVELGKATAADADTSLARLSATTDLAAALAGTDFVIEAAPEKIDLKLDLMAAIDRHAPADAVVSTNTSALSITEMAGASKNASRVAGMHFFNPVHRMKLVEIVRALESSPEALETVEAVARRMGKDTVVVRESPRR